MTCMRIYYYEGEGQKNFGCIRSCGFGWVLPRSDLRDKKKPDPTLRKNPDPFTLFFRHKSQCNSYLDTVLLITFVNKYELNFVWILNPNPDPTMTPGSATLVSNRLFIKFNLFYINRKTDDVRK